jgi:hypothetical protein
VWNRGGKLRGLQIHAFEDCPNLICDYGQATTKGAHFGPEVHFPYALPNIINGLEMRLSHAFLGLFRSESTQSGVAPTKDIRFMADSNLSQGGLILPRCQVTIHGKVEIHRVAFPFSLMRRCDIIFPEFNNLCVDHIRHLQIYFLHVILREKWGHLLP